MYRVIRPRSSFISTMGPNVHTNPSRKQSFLETLFKPKEFENAGVCFREDRTLLLTELFENDGLAAINLFPFLSFLQTQI